MLRTRWILVVLAIFTLALAVPATSAWADSGSGDTSTTPSTDTKVPDDTTTKPGTDTKVPDDTSTKPGTDTTTTTTPDCSDTSSCTETPTTTPETPDVECTENCVPDTGCTGDSCNPDTPNKVPDDVPGIDETPGGGGELPFTGPGDVALAIVLALLAGTGGMLFLFGASGREQLEGLNRRTMDSPSGFHVAYRELRKQQLDD